MGLAAAAIALPTAALASSATAGAPNRAAHPALATCHAATTRVWYGLPGDVATGHFFVELKSVLSVDSIHPGTGIPGYSHQ